MPLSEQALEVFAFVFDCAHVFFISHSAVCRCFWTFSYRGTKSFCRSLCNPSVGLTQTATVCNCR